MRRLVTAAALAGALLVSSAGPAGAANGIGPRCRAANAPRLCAIHQHRGHVNLLRHRMGLRGLPYRWIAERYPARRDRILRYWVRTDRSHRARYAAWRRRQVISGGVPAGVRSTLMCIHPYEEPSWSTSAGGLGFVSSPASYPLTATDHRYIDPLVSRYGNSWYGWPASAQLVVAWRLVVDYGYSPWTTAYHCV